MGDLLGKFVVRMEPSGRVRLPKTLAHGFSELGYLRTRWDGPYHPEAERRVREGKSIKEIHYPYIELFSEQGIEVLSDTYKGRSQPRDDEDKWSLREFSENLVPVIIQGKSRLTLPKEVREHGGFSSEKELLMIGGGECVELWDLKTYNAARAAQDHRKELYGG